MEIITLKNIEAKLKGLDNRSLVYITTRVQTGINHNLDKMNFYLSGVEVEIESTEEIRLKLNKMIRRNKEQYIFEETKSNI